MNNLALNVDALFLSHRQTLIHTIARIVGCLQTAEDITQDAYLKLLYASKTQEIAYPSPFLFQIGRNLALDHLRKQRVRNQGERLLADQDSDDLLESIPATLPSPEQTAADQQQVALLLEGLQGLSERRRACLVLHKFHHWTYERIAKHCGISRSAVEKNVQAALTHLLAAQDGGPLF